MADKFEKHSMYNVTFEIENEDGTKDSFEFKPLKWESFPKVFDVMSKFGDFKEGADTSELMSKLDSKLIAQLAELEREMVKNSYPEKSDDDINRFVMANMLSLLEPLISLTFKESKIDSKKIRK